MKLSTMLLPTGEFILIGSEVSPPHPSLDLLAGLRDATGAAAVLFVEKGVEVEDAVIDEKARRRDTPLTNQAETLSDETFSVEFTADGDDNLLRTLFGGGEFSPAGLVKSVGDRSVQEWADGGHVDIGGADPTIDAEHVDVDEVLASEPRLDSQTITRVNPDYSSTPGEFGRSPWTGPQNHDLNLDDLTVGDSSPVVEVWNPQPGDIVLITGPAYSGSTQWVDKVGNIGVSPNGTPTGTWPVQFELEPPTGNAPFFSRRNFELVARRVTPDEMAGEDLLAALDG